jgi:hypothetical protein
MTEPAIPDSFRTTGYNPAFLGCTHDGCGSQDTVVVTGREGRRCAEHAPVFDPTVAVELMRTDLGAACDYVRGSGLG